MDNSSRVHMMGGALWPWSHPLSLSLLLLQHCHRPGARQHCLIQEGPNACQMLYSWERHCNRCHPAELVTVNWDYNKHPHKISTMNKGNYNNHIVFTSTHTQIGSPCKKAPHYNTNGSELLILLSNVVANFR